MNYKMIIMATNKHNSVVVSVGGENISSSSSNEGHRDSFQKSHFTVVPLSRKSRKSDRPELRFESLLKARQFNVFILLESFLNFCYYLFLVPIRIAKDSRGIYCIRSNYIQKILSTVFLLVITLFSLLDLRHYQRQHNLRENPDQTFKFATIFIIHWIPLCWLIVFWFKGNRFSQLLDICQSRLHCVIGHQSENGVNVHASLEVTRCGFSLCGWVLKVTLFLTATKNFLLFYSEIENSGSLHKYLDTVTDRFLYDFGLESIITRRDYPRLIRIIGYSAGGIHFMLEFVIYMFDQLCFTAALMVFVACQHFLDQFQSLVDSIGGYGRPPRNSTGSDATLATLLRKISTAYLNLITVLEGINEIFGPCIVMFFMYLYPLFIWSIFDSVQNNSLIENLIRIHDISVLCLVTGTAAEASSKVELFRQWLFQASISNLPEEDESNSNALLRLTTMHREVSSEPVGLKGYKFFTVTYRFVATMIGVVITYAIVMFQFVMSPNKSSSNNAASQQEWRVLSANISNNETEDTFTC